MNATPAPAPLSRRLALPLFFAFALSVLVLLAGSAWIVQKALRDEYQASSLRVAALFEASLRNAMLKRDLSGISEILGQLPGLNGVKSATILSPLGQVRFASDLASLGSSEARVLLGLCLHAGCGEIAAPSTVWNGQGMTASLDVIYPVRNQARCAGCHGKAEVNPVNGVLVLNFDMLQTAVPVASALLTKLMLAILASFGLLALAVGGILWRHVLRASSLPVAAVASAGT